MKSIFESSFRWMAAVLFGLILPAEIAAQVPPAESRPLSAGLIVFLSGPEAGFYAAEIPFAAVSPDRAEADVAVEILPTRTAEGSQVNLTFIGLGKFEGRQDTLVYRPAVGESSEETKKGVARILKLGLLRFCAETPAAARIDVLFQDQVKPTAVTDPWDFWVFSLSANGFMMGQESYRSQQWIGNVSANRVTPDWKIRMSASLSTNTDAYDYEGFLYESESRSRSASGLIVRSLGRHWSIGAAVSASSSTYSNQDLYLSFKPAIEFDVFPYDESTAKQLCFLYYAGPEVVRYTEETIFDKTRETLWKQALTVALDLKRPWGTMSVSLTGSHYFHDLSKNRLNLSARVSWRILKGMSFEISGGGSRVRDQLALPKGGASYEEVLLRRRQLATGYDYYFSVGLNYTFGSVFSNIVNPRFGSGGGSSISISM
ncbi:MAG: hypothetical protein JW843_04855 [Candidatus Aminicenantes bacterium]|nr:hypothetical protein [Candidatus Aminicenantes bacterium]